MHSSLISTDDFSDNNITLCISNDNTVYSFGKSTYYAHGHEETTLSFPKQIKNLHDIKYIYCGMSNSCCIDYEGNLYSFGDNKYGQLGIGKSSDDLEKSSVPLKINLPPIQYVVCGYNFSIYLSEDGYLYSCGYNYFGQLGLGNNDNYSSPQLIPDLTDIVLIECGGNSVFCKTIDNIFYSWGYNEYGQLGLGNNDIFSYNEPTKCNKGFNNIQSLKCGYNHGILLSYDGEVFSLGNNEFGQLGFSMEDTPFLDTPTLITNIPEIKRIECGYDQSMLIDIDNNFWVFGYNRGGELGLGDTENKLKPIKHPTLSNIMDISSGGYHTFVKTIDNKIYAFGRNEDTQIGIETSEELQLTPIQVLKGNEDKWHSKISKSRQKSARK